MTQEEIIEMAEKSGMEIWKRGHRYMDDFDIYKFAELVAQHEREACAQVCEDNADDLSEGDWDSACTNCSDLIRARGQA